jgi:ABC-type Zn uptake system ZnuABC Zn-binding protein ZnuA
MDASRRARNLILVAAVAALVPACNRDQPPADVAASNSYLAACAKDLAGPDLEVYCLAEPGACPGHAALRPSQRRALEDGKLLLRFDFQKQLDADLSGPVERGLKIQPVSLGGGMCNPASYVAGCRQVARALVDVGLLDAETSQQRLSSIERRMEALSEENVRRIEDARLTGAAVLTSPHQADFCRALGLNVVGAFTGGDTSSVGRIDQAVRAGIEHDVRLVIANRPEGQRVADVLAERIGGKVVVFDNFPSPAIGSGAVDDLIEANVDRLVEAAR